MSASNRDEPDVSSPPRPRWQFSLRNLLLIAVVVASLSAVVAEHSAHLLTRRSLRKAIRESDQHLNAFRALQARHKRALEDPKELQVEDRSQIYARDQGSGHGAREGPGWGWKIYIPPGRNIWLYISQGSKWDAEQGKYTDSAVSGSLIKLAGEQNLWGCIAKDREGVAYVQIWTEDGSHCARLSDEGYALFRSTADTLRETTGDAGQALLSPSTSPHGRMPLFRWHRAGQADSSGAISEYGFSIYLVDEAPGSHLNFALP